MPGQAPPQIVADQLGRPVEVLQEIDRQPLSLAFLRGRYETYVVRDLVTGERLEITLDLDKGRRVDPVELQNQDRQRAEIQGHRLEPDLLDLVLRHPELERVQVQMHFSLRPLEPAGSEEAGWSDPDVWQAFQAGFCEDLRGLGITLDSPLPADSPLLTVTLSASEIVKLGGSQWIRSIELVGDPEVLDG